MTFQHALNLKREIGQRIIKGGFDMRVMVVPASREFLINYIEEYKRTPNLFTDNTAKKFALDNLFDVYGLHTDGAFTHRFKLS